MAQNGAQQTQSMLSRFYQNKRVPLYLVVGGTWAAAITFLTTNRATHPMVEGKPDVRKDGLPHEHPDAPEQGHNHFESSGRRLTREMGLHGKEEVKGEPQRADGIFKNKSSHKLIEGTPLQQSEKPPKKGQF